MALRQGSPAPNPEDTGGVARAALARGSLLLSLRDAFETIFDELALLLTDPGFDSSVLGEFRARLVARGAAHHLFDVVLEIAVARKLVRAKGRQRIASTHVLAAVRALNRVACVREAMRHALEALAIVAPDWLSAHAPHAIWSSAALASQTR